MGREKPYGDVDSAGSRLICADVSSCWGAHLQFQKTGFSFCPVRGFPCHLAQSTPLLHALDLGFLQETLHLLPATIPVLQPQSPGSLH